MGARERQESREAIDMDMHARGRTAPWERFHVRLGLKDPYYLSPSLPSIITLPETAH